MKLLCGGSFIFLRQFVAIEKPFLYCKGGNVDVKEIDEISYDEENKVKYLGYIARVTGRIYNDYKRFISIFFAEGV